MCVCVDACVPLMNQHLGLGGFIMLGVDSVCVLLAHLTGNRYCPQARTQPTSATQYVEWEFGCRVLHFVKCC